jgi:hypothetical protein
LTLTTAIPENVALGLYYSIPLYTDLQYLGAVSNNRASDLDWIPLKDLDFRTIISEAVHKNTNF